MPEQVGSIEYNVIAETSDLLKAEKQVDRSTTAIANDFKKIDSAAKSTGTQVTKTSKAVKTGLSSVGRGAGQAGIQFQQFIGQIQGGQSAMLALSQQSADLGFVLGAPLLGAVVGISASLIGILAPALLKTIEATKDFAFNVEDAAKELKNLNDLSKAQVSVALTKTSKSMDDLSEAAGDAGNRIAAINQQLDSGNKINVRITKTGRAVIETTKLTARETKELHAELTQEQATLDKINQEYTKQSNLLVKLSENKGGFTKETSKQKDELDKLSKSLEAQKIALEQGEEAAFRYATAQQLNLKAGEKIPANIDEQIRKLFELRKAKEEAAAIETLDAKVQGIGLTPIGQVQARLKTELDLLQEAQDKKIEIEGTYEERRIELRRAAEERIKSINEKATKDSIVNFEALENQVIGTFASVASGAQDGRAAIRSLAQSIATQLVGALIKMGLQAVIGQTTAAATGTATAATLSAAYATPAALASLASFGSNAAPASAGIASTVGLAQSLSLAGGRQYGGPTTQGSNYRVNEAGPEIYSQGGKNFLMNSGGGTVTPVDKLDGGQAVQVIVNNLPGQSATVTETSSDDGRMRQIAIQVVSEQSASLGSDMNRNINKNHNVTNRTGANRRN